MALTLRWRKFLEGCTLALTLSGFGVAALAQSASPAPGEKTLSLTDYRGKPVVVIFYLGAGCLHCVEQLQKFAPRANDFQQAGVSIVGVSTEDLASLTTSVTNFSKDSPFPIPLAADPERRIFKAYRAFDDFENIPLHGTLLIDGAGLVRWQDISFEPFQDVDFVLNEAKRLLSISHPVP